MKVGDKFELEVKGTQEPDDEPYLVYKFNVKKGYIEVVEFHSTIDDAATAARSLLDVHFCGSVYTFGYCATSTLRNRFK